MYPNVPQKETFSLSNHKYPLHIWLKYYPTNNKDESPNEYLAYRTHNVFSRVCLQGHNSSIPSYWQMEAVDLMRWMAQHVYEIFQVLHKFISRGGGTVNKIHLGILLDTYSCLFPIF